MPRPSKLDIETLDFVGLLLIITFRFSLSPSIILRPFFDPDPPPLPDLPILNLPTLLLGVTYNLALLKLLFKDEGSSRCLYYTYCVLFNSTFDTEMFGKSIVS